MKDRNQNIDFLNKLTSSLSEAAILPGHQRLLVALSGGLDSMVLLYALRKLNYTIGACHINFMLRGEESDEDEQFVSEYCHKSSIPIFIVRKDISEYAAELQISIQEAARSFRYSFFNNIASHHNYDFIMTAHHWNDQIETQIQRWIEGAGWGGMMGIPFKNGNIIRPMLLSVREEIANYAIENEIPYREDSSNATDKYTRNYIRHQIVPKFIAINPGFLQTSKNQWIHWREAQDIYLDTIRHFWLQHAFKIHGLYYIMTTSLMNKIGFRSYLYEVLKLFKFSRSITYDIANALSLHKTGTYFKNQTYECVLTQKGIVVRKINAVIPVDILLSALYNTSESIQTTRGIFYLTNSKPINSDLFSLPIDTIPNKAQVRIRTWIEGDYFYPSGMKGKKKLSDWFTDQKISRLERNLYPYVAEGSRVLWIPGKRADKLITIDLHDSHLYLVYQPKDSTFTPLDISQQMN